MDKTDERESFDFSKNKALLIGVFQEKDKKEACLRYLKELHSLADTYGIEAKKEMAVPLRSITAATYIGRGKALEIAKICEEEGIDLVIFDEEISPHQQRNLEKLIKVAVIDRTELILGVFAKHAKTREAKIQVDLAQFKYGLPRLKRLWTHLSRQRTGGAGGGYLKGEGEKQIEIDKRLLRNKIHVLEKELDLIKKQREVQREARKRKQIPTFAIIGYTNAGKSTLLNALTESNVLVEDKLFATLDTTTRKFTLPNRQEILLIDTVGFIRKIPHLLVASFKSTLEEAVFSDILLHLIDVSNEDALEQAEAVYQVLQELKVDRPVITCLNKVDRCVDQTNIQRLKLKYPKTLEISALKKTGLDQLAQKMEEELSKLRRVVKLKIPQSHYGLVAELIKEGKVLSCEYEENDIFLTIEIPASLEKKASPFAIGS